MSSIFYGGIPIEEVDFEKEYESELKDLEKAIKEMKEKQVSGKKFNYHYWTLKLNRANKAMQVGMVTLS